MSDFFALQGGIGHEIPLQKILIELPVTLRLLYLLGILRDLQLPVAQFVFFHM